MGSVISKVRDALCCSQPAIPTSLQSTNTMQLFNNRLGYYPLPGTSYNSLDFQPVVDLGIAGIFTRQQSVNALDESLLNLTFAIHRKKVLKNKCKTKFQGQRINFIGCNTLNRTRSQTKALGSGIKRCSVLDIRDLTSIRDVDALESKVRKCEALNDQRDNVLKEMYAEMDLLERQIFSLKTEKHARMMKLSRKKHSIKSQESQTIQLNQKIMDAEEELFRIQQTNEQIKQNISYLNGLSAKFKNECAEKSIKAKKQVLARLQEEAQSVARESSLVEKERDELVLVLVDKLDENKIIYDELQVCKKNNEILTSKVVAYELINEALFLKIKQQDDLLNNRNCGCSRDISASEPTHEEQIAVYHDQIKQLKLQLVDQNLELKNLRRLSKVKTRTEEGLRNQCKDRIKSSNRIQKTLVKLNKELNQVNSGNERLNQAISSIIIFFKEFRQLDSRGDIRMKGKEIRALCIDCGIFDMFSMKLSQINFCEENWQMLLNGNVKGKLWLLSGLNIVVFFNEPPLPLPFGDVKPEWTVSSVCTELMICLWCFFTFNWQPDLDCFTEFLSTGLEYYWFLDLILRGERRIFKEIVESY